MKRGIRVKVIDDTCGDLPKGIIGLYGIILKRTPKEDERSYYSTVLNRAYLVKLDKRKRTYTLYEDEIRETRRVSS